MWSPGKALRAAMLILAISMVAGNAAAHDYSDGSAIHNHGGDLGSLYAFVPNVGGDAGPLAVVLTIKPFALSVSEVGTNTEYSIRIRPAGLAGSRERLRSKLGTAELEIVCNYYKHDYQIGCIANEVGAGGDRRVLGRVSGDIGETLTANGMRAMSDIRSDPLLINFSSTVNCLEDDEIEFLALEDALKRRVHKRFRN